MRVLNVAEKPSVAKEVSRILSNGNATSTQSCAQFIRNWQFDGGIQGQSCQMVFTSVVGHLMELDFGGEYRGWSRCSPEALFQAPVHKTVPQVHNDAYVIGDLKCLPAQSKKPIERNLAQLARSCQWLVLWLDCDREGENIAFEVRHVCCMSNPQLIVKRAQFSALTFVDLRNALQHLRLPNERDALAVDARQEIDLRVGAAFTRFQTKLLQKKFNWEAGGVNIVRGNNLLLSYGLCQFPVLGLIVQRAWEIEAHVEEPFWTIFASYKVPSEKAYCEFEWTRHRLFDKFVADLVFTFCAEKSEATVTKVDGRERRKWAPCPLSTLELQKGATSALRIPGERVMKYAEELYQAGFISYPRTETDSFPSTMDVRQFVMQQQQDRRWGAHAQSIISGEMWKPPRNGGHDDQAHPPIHPIKYSAGETNWDTPKAQVYEFVVRSFLACCSKDAIGFETSVEIDIAGELFTTKGLSILERNWLDVYPYTNWGGNSTLPNFTVGQKFMPTELYLKEGKTQPPHRLTERDLIEKMERYGIGTDATVAEHIQKQIDRGYAVKNAQLQFSATALGEGLILSYCNMGLDGLWKPDLRGKIEQAIGDIAAGTKTKEEVLDIAVTSFQSDFLSAWEKSNVMIDAMGRFFLRSDGTNAPTVPLYQAQSATVEARGRGRGRGRGGRGRRAGRNTESMENAAPLCPMHQLPVLVLKSNTAQNPGRIFYKCSNEAERENCLPFKWADEFGNGDGAAAFRAGRAPDRGRGGRGRRGRGRGRRGGRC